MNDQRHEKNDKSVTGKRLQSNKRLCQIPLRDDIADTDGGLCNDAEIERMQKRRRPASALAEDKGLFAGHSRQKGIIGDRKKND